jgi:hypothetical protein
MMRRIRGLLTLSAGLWVAGCGSPDRDAYAGSPEEGETAAEGEATPGTAWSEWDADGSDFLDREEVSAWWDDVQADLAWDADTEEGLSREEFVEGVRGAWDLDDDGRVTEEEWRDASDDVWGDEAGAFADWDGDGDSELDANEVSEGLETRGLYDVVDKDRDALVDDEELADWFYDVFDLDDDAEIDQTEWESTWFEMEN